LIKKEFLLISISTWWFYIKVQRTCFSIYINDNRRFCFIQEKKGRNGNELTIGIAIALAMYFDKIFGTLAEKSTFHHYWQSGSTLFFRNISDFFTTQCKTIN
jgi:hypothetical protein